MSCTFRSVHRCVGVDGNDDGNGVDDDCADGCCYCCADDCCDGDDDVGSGDDDVGVVAAGWHVDDDDGSVDCCRFAAAAVDAGGSVSDGGDLLVGFVTIVDWLVGCSSAHRSCHRRWSDVGDAAAVAGRHSLWLASHRRRRRRRW